jgi:hypoxanthine phosphoribosyltransferase
MAKRRTKKPAPAKKRPSARAGKPAAKSRPRASAPQVKHRALPESPAVLEGIDRSGSHSTAHEVSWAQFDAVVQHLAREVGRAFRPEAVVGVAHGGVFVGGALASALKCEFFPVRISRRSRDQGRAAARGLSGVMPKELLGRKVLVVDDIASSGDTLELAKQLAKNVGAKALATATLVSRPKGYQPDYCWERSEAFFVFPWDYELAGSARYLA